MQLRSLRARLALGYALGLSLALIFFAIASLLVLDRLQRATLDQQLVSARDGAASIIDERRTRIEVDEGDHRQFAQIVGGRFDGAVIASNGTTVSETGAALPETVRRSALARPGSSLETLTNAGDPVRAAWRAVPLRGPPLGVLVVWKPTDGIVQLEREALAVYAVAIPLVVIAAIGLGAAIARRGLKPLDDIALQASAIEAHDLSKRLAEPPYDGQLQRLGATLNRMLERLEAAFARQRRLTSDVSHELRTPLAIIAAEAELALARRRDAGEYRASLATILDEARTIDAIIGDLLATARSEARSTNEGEVDVGAIAARGIDRFATLARERDIALRSDLDEDGIVSGDAGELTRAVDAILHNALKYGRAGGSVQVNVVRRLDVIELSIADDGAGFTPEGLAHALERFWRDDSARSEDGTGLGLAIAEAIVTRAGGTIDLANRSAPGGALVVARFPALRASEPPAN